MGKKTVSSVNEPEINKMIYVHYISKKQKRSLAKAIPVPYSETS